MPTATDWFLRLREDHSLATASAFRAWREADPANGRAYDEIARIWDTPALRQAASPQPPDEVRTERRHRRSRWPVMLTAEAVNGPVNGIIARRSSSATKTDTPIIETP